MDMLNPVNPSIMCKLQCSPHSFSTETSENLSIMENIKISVTAKLISFIDVSPWLGQGDQIFGLHVFSRTMYDIYI